MDDPENNKNIDSETTEEKTTERERKTPSPTQGLRQKSLDRARIIKENIKNKIKGKKGAEEWSADDIEDEELNMMHENTVLNNQIKQMQKQIKLMENKLEANQEKLDLENRFRLLEDSKTKMENRLNRLRYYSSDDEKEEIGEKIISDKPILSEADKKLHNLIEMKVVEKMNKINGVVDLEYNPNTLLCNPDNLIKNIGQPNRAAKIKKCKKLMESFFKCDGANFIEYVKQFESITNVITLSEGEYNTIIKLNLEPNLKKKLDDKHINHMNISSLQFMSICCKLFLHYIPTKSTVIQDFEHYWPSRQDKNDIVIVYEKLLAKLSAIPYSIWDKEKRNEKLYTKLEPHIPKQLSSQYELLKQRGGYPEPHAIDSFLENKKEEINKNFMNNKRIYNVQETRQEQNINVQQIKQEMRNNEDFNCNYCSSPDHRGENCPHKTENNKKCSYCGKNNHEVIHCQALIKKMEKIPCETCNSEKHATKECKYCKNCKKLGHNIDKCTSKGNTLHCTYCNTNGHTQDKCFKKKYDINNHKARFCRLCGEEHLAINCNKYDSQDMVVQECPHCNNKGIKLYHHKNKCLSKN